MSIIRVAIILSLSLFINSSAFAQLIYNNTFIVDSNTSVSIVNGKYKIDKDIIEGSKNLPRMLNELDTNFLEKKWKVEDIPTFIISFMDSLTGPFVLANTGEPYTKGCIVETGYKNDSNGKSVKYNLPSRQLAFLGIGNDMAIITYCQGGIASSEYILIFKFKGNTITDFWATNINSDDIKTQAQIMRLLKSKISDESLLKLNFCY
ncbi:MAG: hypothetical protein V4613_03195 [Bacteroidota bacterium]